MKYIDRNKCRTKAFVSTPLFIPFSSGNITVFQAHFGPVSRGGAMPGDKGV